MAKRSEFLGVYNVAADQLKDENKPFRVAIRFNDRKTGERKWFNVPQHFSTEVAAARVYNAYAIRFFGKGAILNKINEIAAMENVNEVHEYFNATPNREKVLQRSSKRVRELLEAGHVFRQHTEVNRA